MSSNWTANDVPDLSGKTIIVTGGNSGIGYEAAKVFAAKGAHTVLACRNPAKGESALSELKQNAPNASAELMQLDLASLASVKQFAAEANDKFDQIDILVNNAGIMMTPYGTTEDGFEQQFGVNHLGHFALTGHLLDKITKVPDSRIVNVSSTAHKGGSVEFDNLMYEGGNGYSALRAYGRSKLANLLFTYELQKRLESAGSPTLAVAAHPGGSKTNLSRHVEGRLLFKILTPLFNLMMSDADGGALPTLRAAVDPQAKGNDYYGPSGLGEMSGPPVLVKANDSAKDPAVAAELWTKSEELTGVQYLN